MNRIFWTIPTINARNLNRHTTVDLIRFTPGGIPRVELARQLSLTRSAVTEIVDDLIERGIVREMDHQPAGGRQPISLEIDPSLGYVVGVDIGASHVTVILADTAARVLHEADLQIDINQGPDTCLPIIDCAVQDLLSAGGIASEKILAVGVGVPGPIVTALGGVHSPPIMAGWDRYPIREHFEKTWRCPVILNNDAELGALGEWAYGAGRGERNLVYIKVGTGIGAGLLLDGQIYHGASGSAGEIGHITIDETGPLCTCGNYGCLEAMSGGRAIARKAAQAVQTGQRTLLSAIETPGEISIRDVLSSARRGDLLSQTILSEAGMHLGTAVAGLVNLFNPSVIIMGGGVSQIGDLLIEPIRQMVQKRSLPGSSRSVRIVTALLGRRSSAMGAVVQAISHTLHQTLGA